MLTKAKKKKKATCTRFNFAINTVSELDGQLNVQYRTCWF